VLWMVVVVVSDVAHPMELCGAIRGRPECDIVETVRGIRFAKALQREVVEAASPGRSSRRGRGSRRSERQLIAGEGDKGPRLDCQEQQEANEAGREETAGDRTRTPRAFPHSPSRFPGDLKKFLDWADKRADQMGF
jgi:hypothetical protein